MVLIRVGMSSAQLAAILERVIHSAAAFGFLAGIRVIHVIRGLAFDPDCHLPEFYAVKNSSGFIFLPPFFCPLFCILSATVLIINSPVLTRSPALYI